MVGWEFNYKTSHGETRFGLCTGMKTDIETGVTTVYGISPWGNDLKLTKDEVTFEKEEHVYV